MGPTLLGVLTVALSLTVAVVVGVGSAYLGRRQWFMKSLRYCGCGLVLLVLPLATIWFTGCGLAEISNHSGGEINAGVAVIASFLSAAAIVIEFAMFLGVLMLLSCEWVDGELHIRSGSMVDRIYHRWYSTPYVWRNGEKQSICFLSWNLVLIILVLYPVVFGFGSLMLFVASVVTLLFSGHIVVLGEDFNPTTKPVMDFAPIVPLLFAAAIASPIVVGMYFFGYSFVQVFATCWGLVSALFLGMALAYRFLSHTVVFSKRPDRQKADRVRSQHTRPPSKVDTAVISALHAVGRGAVSLSQILSQVKQAACPTIHGE